MSDDATDTTPRIHRRTDGSSTLVTLGGEVDVLTAPGVSAALDALTGADRPDIVVDLRPVEFIDCSGLSAPRSTPGAYGWCAGTSSPCARCGLRG